MMSAKTSVDADVMKANEQVRVMMVCELLIDRINVETA